MKILIFMQKVGNFWKITILRSPETLVFLVVFAKCPHHFQSARPFSQFYQKRAEFHHSKHFGCPNVTFWPRIGLLGTRLRTLYKHKLLGGFLEAPSRQSAFWTKKAGFSAPKQDFHGKCGFRAKSWNSAKTRKCSRNLTISALKSCSKNPILLFLEPFC